MARKPHSVRCIEDASFLLTIFAEAVTCRTGKLNDERTCVGVHPSELASVFRAGRSGRPDGPALDNGLL